MANLQTDVWHTLLKLRPNKRMQYDRFAREIAGIFKVLWRARGG